MTTVTQIVSGRAASDGAGVKLKRVLGQPALTRLDPFLMLDEFGSDTPADYLAGFPPHPHRGFQTVTYMLNGKMGHKDSVGNQGVIEDGGLQWMNAGKGIIHEEMPQQTEGLMRGFQLWVNLPASEKMSEPAYYDIKSADINEVNIGQQSKARVLAGELNGVAGAVTTQAVKPQFYDLHLVNNENIIISVDKTHNAFIYVYEGEILVADRTLVKGQLATLNLSTELNIKSTQHAKAIFVSGKPIGEPIVQYGPFVMNSQTEIEQAIEDFRANRLA
ncbi:MAG: pirin family protein [Glaciecola sp.]